MSADVIVTVSVSEMLKMCASVSVGAGLNVSVNNNVCVSEHVCLGLNIDVNLVPHSLVGSLRGRIY